MKVLLITLLFTIGCTVESSSMRDDKGNTLFYDTLTIKGKVTKMGISSGEHQEFINHISTSKGSMCFNTTEYTWSIGDSVNIEVYSKDLIYLDDIKVETVLYVK